MKCKSCGYHIDIEIDEYGAVIEPNMSEGSFFYVGVANREFMLGGRESRSVYGCPKCGNVFVDLS